MQEQPTAVLGGPSPGLSPNALVESHLHLVEQAVNQLASKYPRHIDRHELWSAGATGLVDASQRYVPETGVPFGPYASIRIRGAIIDSTRARDWATRSLRRDLRTLATRTAMFEQTHGRTPTAAELARELGMSESDVLERRAAAATANLLHLDQSVSGGPGGDDEALSFGDRIREVHADRLPEDRLERTELVGTVRVAVDHLPATQRAVVRRYFFDGERLRDIADDLGVTEARVSQIRNEALTSVRAFFSFAFDGVDNVAHNAPGMRRRADYIADVAANSTWRSRLEAGAPAVAVGA